MRKIFIGISLSLFSKILCAQYNVTIIKGDSMEKGISFFYNTEKMDYPSFFLNNKRKEIGLKINTPTFLIFSNPNFVNSPILVFPDDTVNVFKNDDEFYFRGNRQNEWSFLTALNKKGLGITFADTLNWHSSNLGLEIKRIVERNTERQRLLRIAQKELKLSKEFSQVFEKELKFHLITSIFFDYSPKIIVVNGIHDEILKLTHLLNEGSVYYGSRNYLSALYGYNRFLCNCSERLPPNFEKLYDYASKIFIGNEKDFLTFFLLYEQIFWLNNWQNSPDTYTAYIEDFLKSCKNTDLINNIKNLLENLEKGRIVESDEFLSQEILTVTGEKITWYEILKRNKSKIAVVDFWASWCKPCIEEMPKSNKIREKFLEEGKEINFVYISIDKDESKWRDAFKKSKLSNAQNYLLAPDSNLSNYIMKENGIPRYFILSKYSKVISSNAYRPSTIEFKRQLDELLEKNKNN